MDRSDVRGSWVDRGDGTGDGWIEVMKEAGS